MHIETHTLCRLVWSHHSTNTGLASNEPRLATSGRFALTLAGPSAGRAHALAGSRATSSTSGGADADDNAGELPQRTRGRAPGGPASLGSLSGFHWLISLRLMLSRLLQIHHAGAEPADLLCQWPTWTGCELELLNPLDPPAFPTCWPSWQRAACQWTSPLPPEDPLDPPSKVCKSSGLSHRAYSIVLRVVLVLAVLVPRHCLGTCGTLWPRTSGALGITVWDAGFQLVSCKRPFWHASQ